MPHGNNWRFIQAAADFLAHADERDRIDFSRDLLRNIKILFDSARFLDWIEERSAFFDFTFRRKIQSSQYSSALLRLVSEPQFCATLVHRSPWNTAAILGTISEKNLFARAGKSFVQELGRQAIISQYSMIGREMEFKGFRSAPVLTDALFSDQFINRQYEPLRGLEYGDFSNVDEGIIERLNHAIITCLRNALEHHDYWMGHNLLGISDLYEWVSYDVKKQIKLNEERYGLVINLKFGLTDIIKATNEHLSNLEQRRRSSLYWRNGVARDSMVLDYVAKAIVEVLKSISNDFEGFDSRFWNLALDVIDEVFPRYSEQPDGMNPLQQRVALKLINEVRKNMDGFYPAISRVMLAVIGPFGKKDELDERCAYRILERAFYAELRKYPDLSERDPKKAADFLPPNVRYVPEQTALVHQYRGGQEQSTELRSLQLGEVSLSADVVGQIPEIEGASSARGE